MLDNRICADLCRFGAEGGNLTDILLALGIPGIVRGLQRTQTPAPSPNNLPRRTAKREDKREVFS
jgi:hypothetical protein